jgi:subtilisin family serine protease
MKRFLQILSLLLFMSASVMNAQNGASNKITADLMSKIEKSQNSNDLIRVIIVMNEQYDASKTVHQMRYLNKPQKRDFVINELKRISNNSQMSIVNELQQGQRSMSVSDINRHWIVNGITCSMSKDMILDIAGRSDVAYLTLNYEVSIPDGEVNEPNIFYSKGENQWNVVMVNADDVWETGVTGNGVIVAVIDTGVNYNHNDITNNMWDGSWEGYPYHGWDFVNDDNDPMDDHCHGTHCAGTVSSYGTNGYQCGIAKDAKIMALKVLGSNGRGYTEWIINAMEFGVEHGAHVLSMSLGADGVGGESVYRVAMENVLESGVVASVAAGNTGDELDEYPVPYNVGAPGNCPSPWRNPDQTLNGGRTATVTVGATTSTDEYSYFSSIGPVTWTEGSYIGSYYDYPYTPNSSVNIGLIKPDVSAPGSSIVSLYYGDNTGYSTKSGTSMATPCVAGVMALMLEANPMLTPVEIDSILEVTAVPLGGYTSKNNYFGAGRVDAQAAVATAAAMLAPGEVVVNPDTINMGYRPNNAWMAPKTIVLNNIGGAIEIQNIQISDPYFQFDLGDVTLPYNIGYHKTLPLKLTTANSSNNGTPISAQLTVYYGNGKQAQAMVTAVPYNPATGDVWETAYQVNSLPYTDSLVASSIPLYNNYNMPPTNTEDGADAVYKLVFDQDVNLNASLTSGENGKLILYREGFRGEGGPMEENYFGGVLNNSYYGTNVQPDIIHSGGSGSQTVEVTIGDPASTTTNSYLPTYSLYNYALTQQIYTADEIGVGGNINSLTMWLKNTSNYARNLNVYMKETNDDTFASGNAWVSMTSSDIVATFTLNNNISNPVETSVNLNAPFAYSGNGNLVICIQDVTGSWSSGVAGVVLSTNGKQSIYAYRDSFLYDPTTPGVAGTIMANKNVVKLNITTSEPSYTITDMVVSPGIYYLVTSSTSNAWGVEINSGALECPEVVSNPIPSDYNTDVNPTAVNLKWKFGERTTEYKLLFGNDNENLETMVDWTRDLKESYVVTGLLNNTDYFWQIIERNDGCPEGVEGPVWGFTTLLNGPQDLYAANSYLFEGDDSYLEWTPIADTNILSYNIYQDNVWIGNTTANNYTVSGLTYNMEGYNYYVTAVYAGGESNASNTIAVYVSGNGSVAGHVYEQDGITGVEYATVTFSGNDEFGYYRTFDFTTDIDGYYTGSLKAGSYSARAARSGYQTNYYDGMATVVFNELTEGIDIVMDEVFYPVSVVTASYYPDDQNPNSPYVKVNWDTYTETVYDFDDSSMQGWTTIDADGDGNVWVSSSNPGIYHNSGVNLSGTGHNGSEAYVISGSYANQTSTALYPDNYIVSPQMTIGGSITFYACAQDASYAAEHFGIAVSTSDNTDASAFTTIQEWTMTAKSSGAFTEFTRSGNRGQGAWYQYTVDLSSYVGQTGYVAIRHFDCYDQFILNIDDIVIREPNNTEPTRAFSHYRVYRTNAYNNGPFTEENTVLLADNVTETLLIDVSWPEAESGVYKYGVSRVYEGNRESEIRWGELQQNNNKPSVLPRAPIYPIEDCSAGPAPISLVPENSNLPVFRNYNTDCVITQEGTECSHFTLNDPSNVSSYGVYFNEFTQAACYINGIYYYANSSGNFGTFNPSTGPTLIASNRPYGLIEFNPVDGKMYGISFGNGANVYEVNPIDGSYTWINSMASSYALTFTITGDGRFIICDAGDECIKEYDLATGTLTPLIYVDWNINFGQDMAMDLETNELYWAAYNASDGTHPLIKIDLNAGTLTTIGYFINQASAFANATAANSIQGERESAITWSNAIDKNMYLGENDVNITVTLNSGDSPEGVVVSFTNINAGEQSLYPVEDVTLDATGYYAWDSFRRGDYQVQVSFNDYYTITEEVSIWDATALNYVLEEINYGLSNLYVSRTGWAMWTDSEHGNTVPVIGGDANNTFFVDFEEGFPFDWTTIDANNDGYTWLTIDRIGEWGSNYQGMTFNWAHNSSNSALSSSYLNGIGVLYPDDFLVSPKVIIENGSHISFWAAATDMNYAADHFGIAVSTGSNTNANDFVVIQEWTMTAKGGPRDGDVRDRNNGNRDINTWYYYDVDLSAYAGLEVYLAFRHFNCSDQYILTVDDVELYNSFAKNNRHFNNYQVVLTDIDDNVLYQTTSTDCYMQLPVENLVDGERYRLKVATDYSSGLGDWNVVEWNYQSCDHFEGVTDLNLEMNDTANIISWSYPVLEERSIMTGGYPAYALRRWNGDNSNNPTGWYSFDLNSLEIINLINSNLSFYGGDYCPLDGYVHSINNSGDWFVINPETGEIIDQGYLGIVIRDCTWDYSSNKMYGTDGNYLYLWDIENNTYSKIGNFGTTIQVLACDLQGQLFGISYDEGALYRIDKLTGTSTYVGATGQGCYYYQSATFDHYTGKMYWTGINSYDIGFFAEVDTETGQATVLANNTGQQASFCVPFNGIDYVSPVTGVLGAILYRDGELLGFTSYNTYTDTIATGNHEYEVRVVYDGMKHSINFNAYYAMSCPTSIGGESYEVTVTPVPAVGGTVTGSGTYINGFPCTVTATENDGFAFTGWTINDQVVSTTPEYTFRVTNDVTVEGNFIGFTPHWTVVDNPAYQPTSLIGVLQINGVEQGANYLEIAALSGNECRGRQMMTYYPELNRYLIYMTIYGMDNDQITFDMYDHMLGQETEYVCLNGFTFMTNETFGSTTDPFVIDFGVIQETAMQIGWNWYASAVEADGIEALEMLENSLGANGVMIKSQTEGFVMNYENYWVGNLNALSNDQMYMIKSDAQVNATLGGYLPDVTNHSITIYPGWTWLGYPSYNALDINDALEGFNAKDGDLLKAKQSFSSYVEGIGWMGSLQTLTPGQGMMYYSTRSVSTTLTYSGQGNRQELLPNITAENNHWVPNAFEYPENMSVMAVVEIDDTEIAEGNYELAAFDCDKCVGSAKIIFVEPINRYVSFLTISGEEDRELQFGLYNSNTGMELFNLTDVLEFEPNAIIGSLDRPYVVNFSGMTGVSENYVATKIYPNPVDKSTQFIIDIASSKADNMIIEIVDALGNTVSVNKLSGMPVVLTAPSASGVYMIKIHFDGTENYCRKLIVK